MTRGMLCPHRIQGRAAAVLLAAAIAVALPALLAPLLATAGAAPSGTVTTVPAGATRRPAIVLDASGIAGATQMQLTDSDGASSGWIVYAAQTPWTFTGADGLKTITAQFTDGVDPNPYAASVQIYLDRKRPTTVGFSSEVKRGQLATLYYKVKDPKPSCKQANVRLVVFRFGKRKTTFKLGVVATNTKLSKVFTCRWDKGWYTYEVRATDIAGNRHKTPAGVGVLFVK